MDDGPSRNKSFLESLKNEWSLLWSTLLEEEPQVQLPSEEALTGKVKMLSLDQIRSLSKGLSLERKHLNTKLEYVQKEIEHCQIKAESLRLTNSDQSGLLKRIEELTDQGVQYSEALTKLDEQLKMIRQRENEILGFEPAGANFRAT